MTRQENPKNEELQQRFGLTRTTSAPSTARGQASAIADSAASTDKHFAALADDITGIREDIASVKGEIADLRTGMLDEFEHVDTQFAAIGDQLRDMTSEIVVIHRRIERLEEQGAGHAGFAKKNDHALERIAAIEKHLGLDKQTAA